jgi:hypothetical protein
MPVVELAALEAADKAAGSRACIANVQRRHRRNDGLAHAAIVIALSSRRQYSRLCLGRSRDTTRQQPF